jgi:hypothetical protein
VEIGRIAVGGQSRQKVSETPPSQINLGVMVHACHSSHAGSINRRTEIQAGLGNKPETLLEKCLKEKGLRVT